MKQLTRLYLFVHPMPSREQTRQEYMPKWDELFLDQGPDETIALCILSNGRKEMAELESMGQRSFGERCIMDPHDISDQTKVLLADDLLRTFGERGHDGEWLPYEIWSAGLARKWTEGLKKSLDNRGLTYDPGQLHLVTCGQQWGGCHAKYSALMAKYLGLMEAPDVRADLSPDAGWPVKADFIERVKMDQQVYLFLFKTADGRPMAQYLDGLRAVWERPHVATVELDASKVEAFTMSPNESVPVNTVSEVRDNTVIADVGDGIHPAFTTIIANTIGYEEFREALTAAKITDRNERSSVRYMIAHMDPLTNFQAI